LKNKPKCFSPIFFSNQFKIFAQDMYIQSGALYCVPVPSLPCGN
jgi:hypothetical protein